MTRFSLPNPPRWLLLWALAAVAPAQADKADRTQPIVVEADRPGTLDLQRQVVVFNGNVQISQGTMQIFADRIDVRELPGGHRAAVALGVPGKPAGYRQKRDGLDETVEGKADRIEYDGKTGQLRLAGSDAVVLVQRGWAPRHRSERETLPPVQTPGGEVRISGRIAEHPPRVYQLGREGQGAIRQNLDLDAFRAETGLPLAGLMVWQTGAASEGLRRDWPEADSGVDKHYGYAFQWFGLCALIGVLFLWFQVVRPFYRSRQA